MLNPLSILLLLPILQDVGVDRRNDYDVDLYRLDLKVEPQEKRISGRVGVEFVVTSESMSSLVLDIGPALKAEKAWLLDQALEKGWKGKDLKWKQEAASLDIQLGRKAKKGERLSVAIQYSGSPRGGRFSGFHWAKTPTGKPWINTSCQGPGAQSWWPCKASFFHPEDKPDRGMLIEYTVPKGLTAVANGRLLRSKASDDGKWTTWSWRHEYPLCTYSVTMNVAPYVHKKIPLKIKGTGVDSFEYWVLPENVEKADLQFEDVPGMLAIYAKAFGPFPFPKSKFALVETNFWGMEHSTAVAYGSSYPKWLKKRGKRDRYGSRNRFYDYILIHESAHEWWGNGVSAKTWGDFWIHEGFGTYAEAVYLEGTRGRKEANRWFRTIRGMAMGPKARLFRGKNVNSGQAYAGVIYYKGAWVLNTLRTYVDDDIVWWKTVRDFNMAFRYKNANTADFQAILEKNTGKKWKRFFDQWIYQAGVPKLTGTIQATKKALVIDIENNTRAGRVYHLPLDITWIEGGKEKKLRLWLEPGQTKKSIPTQKKPKDIHLPTLDHILCGRRIKIS
jgi:aminopeptidase N